VDNNFLRLTDDNVFAFKMVFIMAPNIFSTVIGDFFLHTPGLWVLGMDRASCHNSGV
jgi:hypothetical protein